MMSSDDPQELPPATLGEQEVDVTLCSIQYI